MRKKFSKNNIKGIVIVSLIGIFFLMNFISANSYLQQVIFTDINLTITIKDNIGEYEITGEGINAKHTFAINVINNSTAESNYSRYNIPITFTRLIDRNETDVDVILKAMANSNATELYFNCSSQLKECLHDIEYETNFTFCSNSLTSCQGGLTSYQTQISEANNKVSSLKTHRLILLVLAVLLGFFTYKFYSQTVLKQAKTNWKGMVGPSRIQ